MLYPKWITALDLDRWAATPQAKVMLPDLVRRLVFATVPREHLQKIDFPAGAEIQRPGYDGTTVTTEGTAFVPQGVAFWELGCEVGKAKGKAQSDYDARIGKHKERIAQGETENLKEATYVAVTPLDWQTSKDWEKERNKDGYFGNVRAYDSNGLEHWIQDAPAVGLWLAQEIRGKLEGVIDISWHWESVQATLLRPLPAKVLLVTRETIGTAFEKWLGQSGGELAVKAPSPSELIAVFCAWVQTLSAERQHEIASRSIIVESREAWRALSTSQQRLILIAASRLDGDADLFADATRHGHHVLRHAGFSVGKNQLTELPMMRRFELHNALVEAEIPDAEAGQLAEAAGGNFTILRRRFAKSADPAPWAGNSVLASLLLVPAWEDNVAGDQRIVSEVVGKEYSEVQAIVTKLLSEQDAPVRRVLETWEFLSPVDAWEMLNPLLTSTQMERFQHAAIEVLSEDDPALELPPDERFMAAIKGKVRKFSKTLRRGIAEILALAATREEEGKVATHLRFAARAAQIVSRVLPPGCSWQRWASLDELLPLLMEAAPEVMITTLEKDVASGTSQLAELLEHEVPGGITGRIYHTGTLWALETAGWAPERLQRVSLVLARLAKREAGDSRWVNRPSASLSSLFFSWRAQTVASVGQRIEALKYLRAKEPEQTWSLILELMPKTHEAISDNPKPTYRTWAAGWTGEVTLSDYKALIAEATSMAVELTEEKPEQWPSLVGHIAQLRRGEFDTVLAGLERLAVKSIAPDLRESVWNKLREIVRRHDRFRTANWALPEAELKRLETVMSKFTPSNSLTIIAPLFNSDGWDEGPESESYDEKVEKRQKERRGAIREIWKAGKAASVLELAKRVRQPWSVGWSLAEELGSEAEEEIVPRYLASEEDSICRFAAAFAHRRIQSNGVDWAERRSSESWAPQQIAAWALQMPFNTRTWDWVASKGNAFKRLYWERTQVMGHVGLDLPARARAATELQEVGRPWSALGLLMLARYDKSPLTMEVVCGALEAILTKPSEHELGAMDAHYVHEAFQFLQEHVSAGDDARVARLEFNFLPFLDGYPVLPTTLQRELSKSPDFFVDCLKILYKPHNRPNEEPSDSPEQSDPERAAKATRIWRLIRDWQVIPGTGEDGVVSPEKLRSWLNVARQKARDSDRLEVCDLTLGELFARSPLDQDKGLPVVAVRGVIEELESEELERGLWTGLRNLRQFSTKSLYEGGKQERDLAAVFDGYSVVCAKWPRTAAVLRGVAKSYLDEAEREDERARMRD